MALTLSVIDQIKKGYGLSFLSNLTALKPPDGRALWRVETDLGEIVILVFSQDQPASEVQKDLDILKFLNLHHFPAPRLYQALDGRDFILGPNKERIALTSYIAGIPGNSVDQRRPKTFSILGKLLADLHNLGMKTRYFPFFHLSRRDPKILIPKQLNEIKQAFEFVTKEWWTILQVIRDQMERLPSFKHLPYTIIHTDAWEGNMILQGCSKGVLVDWYDAGWAPAVVDLAFPIVQTCLSLSDDSNKVILHKNLLASLVRNYQQVRQLSELEIDYMPDALRFANYSHAVGELMMKIREGKRVNEVLNNSHNFHKFMELTSTNSPILNTISEVLYTGINSRLIRRTQEFL